MEGFKPMDNYDEEDRIPDLGDRKGSNKALLMIFVVDTSGSMKIDGRIEAVNAAFESMIPKLREKDAQNSSYTLYIAIMTFNNDVDWVVSPTKIANFDYKPLQIINNNATRYSRAFHALHEEMREDRMFGALEGRKSRPYILFMTDGAPSPNDEYLPALQELRKTNGWFVNSDRYAVLMGSAATDERAKQVVSVFVDNPQEGVIAATDAGKIAEQLEAHTLRTFDLRMNGGDDVVAPKNSSTDSSQNSNATDSSQNSNGGTGPYDPNTSDFVW